MSLTGGIRPHDTFSYFELHCRAKRETNLWMITSDTCANCAIIYVAHFEHLERGAGLLRGIAEPWSTMTAWTP